MLPRAINELQQRAKRFAPLLLLASFPLQAAQLDVAVVGPVDSLNCRLRSLTVLGVAFTATNKAAADAICSSSARPGLTYVSAVGTPTSKGEIKLNSLVVVSAEGYVAGASAVYLRGEVTQANPLTGEFVVSGIVVSARETTPSVGTYVEVLGSRPGSSGSVLSTSIVPVDANSSAGTGKLSSSGTGALSSSGTGVNSSAGTGALSSSGTGVNSSAGTGKQSSSGTGALSSSGTGALSSSGTGVLSSSGTGVLSSVGTGTSSN